MGLSRYKTKTSLILPFKGVWVVGNGGKDPKKNNHFDADGSGPNSQRFAYDFFSNGLPAQFAKIKVNGDIKENYEPERGQKVENI